MAKKVKQPDIIQQVFQEKKIWWYKGLRRLMLTPWIYKVPDLKFIKDYEQRNKA